MPQSDAEAGARKEYNSVQVLKQKSGHSSFAPPPLKKAKTAEQLSCVYTKKLLYRFCGIYCLHTSPSHKRSTRTFPAEQANGRTPDDLHTNRSPF